MYSLIPIFLALLVNTALLNLKNNIPPQSGMLTPSTFVDSIHTAILHEDKAKFQRQFLSKDPLDYSNNNAQLEQHGIKDVKALTHEEAFDQLLALYQKHNFNENNISFRSEYTFKSFFFEDQQLTSLPYVASPLLFDIFNDSIQITILSELYFDAHQWKSVPIITVLEARIIKPANSVNKEDLTKIPEVKSIPVKFETFGSRIVSILKDKDSDELLKAYPNKESLNDMGITSDFLVNNTLNSYQQNIDKLQQQFTSFKSIEILDNMTSVRWEKRNSLRPTLLVKVHLKTDQGKRLLSINGIVTENKIFLNYLILTVEHDKDAFGEHSMVVSDFISAIDNKENFPIQYLMSSKIVRFLAEINGEILTEDRVEAIATSKHQQHMNDLSNAQATLIGDKALPKYAFTAVDSIGIRNHLAPQIYYLELALIYKNNNANSDIKAKVCVIDFLRLNGEYKVQKGIKVMDLWRWEKRKEMLSEKKKNLYNKE